MAKRGGFAPGLTRVGDSVKSAGKPSLSRLAKTSTPFEGAAIPDLYEREINSTRNLNQRIPFDLGRRR